MFGFRGDKALGLDRLIRRITKGEGTLRLLRVRGSAGPYLVTRLREQHAGPILLVTSSSQAAERWATDLCSFGIQGDSAIFARYDTPPFDRFSPHPDIEANRMSLLYRLLAATPSTPLCVISPWTALLRRVPSRAELRGRVTHLERGMNLDRDALLEVLVSAGYHRRSLVEERGEVASRGGILDLFPPHLQQPVRIEFDFDGIGSIRYFDPASQRSAHTSSAERDLRAVTAIPPRAYCLPADLEQLGRRLRQRGRLHGVPESNLYALREAIARRHLPAGIENLEWFLHKEQETVFDYLPDSALVLLDDPDTGLDRAGHYEQEIREGYARARAQDRLICEPEELYTTARNAEQALRAKNPVLLDPLGVRDTRRYEEPIEFDARDHRELRHEIKAGRGSDRALEPLARRLQEWQDRAQRIRLVCPSLSAAERLADILRDYGQALPIARGAADEAHGIRWSALPEPGRAEIAISKLTEGFELPLENLVVVSEQDVFGTRQRRRIPHHTRRGRAIERLAQIQTGDPLVHAEHGIGTYGGLVQLEAGGIRQEFMLLAYAGNDKLYLPISRLAQVQRYTGTDSHAARLDRLGGQNWARTKKKVQRAVREMADELLAVVAARQVLQGHAYPPPDASYEEFEALFPYEDTPDQRRATEDVLADLQREQPMDRLICGDVGFGKTEIACRAAYQVTSSGRQVAFLVPTTVLCQQHFRTLEDRFADTAVEIASISRLSTTQQIREAREGLASGRIDIVLGTHRLLSRDVRFRNLGLLITDEEHRFGVAHKERLKQLRKLVDVLTLSATPIPRTLHMALSGMRDLSVISTPPPDRIAIRTEVCRISEDLIREAVLRELQRGGQVFFVHNRVETIAEFSTYVKGIVPEARIRIAHGRMPGPKLEEVMLDFVNHEFDVLLCTAIIESGLDLPNCNTMLIHRADHFGLAQLHQLRGRVGRSDRRAYAYLLLPSSGQPTEEGRKRIEAIQDLSELGAGFRLAMDDLEIRGAGNVLGPEQSGQIAAVGYDLYMEMLEQAIAELRGNGMEPVLEPEISLPIAALLPEPYVPSVNQRLVLYKQLSSARSEEELAEIRDDLLDRFGSLPPEARNLIEVIRLKVRCRRLGIAEVTTVGSELVIRVIEPTCIDPHQLVRVLHQPDAPIRVSPDHRIYLRLRKTEDALAESFGMLDLLAPPDTTGREAQRTGDAA